MGQSASRHTSWQDIKELLICILDVEFGLLTELNRVGILNDVQLINLQRNRDHLKNAESVLDHFNKLPDEHKEKFLEVLDDSDISQKHVANFIRNNGQRPTTDQDNWPLYVTDLWTKIRLNRTQLTELIDTEHGLLDEMVAVNCIIQQHEDDISNNTTHNRRNERLVAILMRRSVTDYNSFIRCLLHTRQHHVVFLIEPEQSENVSPLNDECKSRLKLHKPALLECIDITNAGFLTLLYQCDCISARQKERIVSELVESDKIKRLLQIIERGSQQNFTKFLKCLEDSGQKHICEIVMNKVPYAQLKAYSSGTANIEQAEKHIVNQFKTLLSSVTEEMRGSGSVVTQIHKVLHEFERGDTQLVTLQVCHSIRLFFVCNSLSGVQYLYDLYSSKRLEKIVQLLFRLLLKDDTGLIVDRLHWKDSDYNKCKLFFAASTAPESICLSSPVGSSSTWSKYKWIQLAREGDDKGSLVSGGLTPYKAVTTPMKSIMQIIESLHNDGYLHEDFVNRIRTQTPVSQIIDEFVRIVHNSDQEEVEFFWRLTDEINRIDEQYWWFFMDPTLADLNTGTFQSHYMRSNYERLIHEVVELVRKDNSCFLALLVENGAINKDDQDTCEKNDNPYTIAHNLLTILSQDDKSTEHFKKLLDVLAMNNAHSIAGQIQSQISIEEPTSTQMMDFPMELQEIIVIQSTIAMFFNLRRTFVKDSVTAIGPDVEAVKTIASVCGYWWNILMYLQQNRCRIHRRIRRTFDSPFVRHPTLLYTVIMPVGTREVSGVAIINSLMYVISNGSDIIHVIKEAELHCKIQVNQMKPRGITSFKDKLYVADPYTRCIWWIDAKTESNGKFMEKIDAWSLCISEAEHTMLVTARNVLHLVNLNTRTVQKSIRLQVHHVEETRNARVHADVEISHALQISKDRFLAVYVGQDDQTLFNQAAEFDSDGKVIRTFGGRKGSGPMELSQPFSLDVDWTKGSWRSVFICDHFNARIVLLDRNLRLVGLLLTKQEHGVGLPLKVRCINPLGRKPERERGRGLPWKVNYLAQEGRLVVCFNNGSFSVYDLVNKCEARY